MLRTIFSLIQRIIDSDKQYKNTKSRAVIYCLSRPDNFVNMDLQVDGKTRKSLSLQNGEQIENGNKMQLQTEQGDVGCSYNMIESDALMSHQERVGDRASFVHDAEDVIQEKKVEITGQPHVHDLLKNFQGGSIKFLQKDKDQVSMLLEQITKMKVGLQRLYDIAHQIKSSEKLASDMTFLEENLKNALKESNSDDTNLSSRR